MIKFGPSGNSEAFHNAGLNKSEDSAVWVKNLGLSCFEYSFGRGVNLSDEKAEQIGKAFLDNGVEISVHAPYYINFSNPEEENAEKSYGYVLRSAEKVGAEVAVTDGKRPLLPSVILESVVVGMRGVFVDHRRFFIVPKHQWKFIIKYVVKITKFFCIICCICYTTELRINTIIVI